MFTYDVVNQGSLKAKYQKVLINDIEKKDKITLEIAKTIFEEADFDGDGRTDDNETFFNKKITMMTFSSELSGYDLARVINSLKKK